MESAQIKSQNNAFLNYLLECVNKKPVAEPKKEVSTIDGDIISEKAMHAAIKTGKGVMIGDFFVGSTLNTDVALGYSFSI